VPRDGLGDPIINAIAEDQQNSIWVATNGGGVARLIDDAQGTSSDQAEPGTSVRQKFVGFRIADSAASNIVNGLAFDSQDKLWCATDGGIYRAATGQGGDLKFEFVASYQSQTQIAFADRQGRLWFGTQNKLIEIVQDQIIEYGPDDGVARHPIARIIEDGQGKVIAANQSEIFELIEPAEGEGRGRWRKRPLTLKPDQGINTILSDSAGALWIGTWDGLIKYRDGKQTLYTSVQGLSDSNVLSLVEDRDGNLWIGTEGGGVCKLSSELIVTFTRTEGLPNQNVRKVIEDMKGNIFASIANGGLVKIVEERAVPLLESQAPPSAISTSALSRIDTETGGSELTPVCFVFKGLSCNCAEARSSPPPMESEARSINYARLAAGSYQFLERAINQEDIVNSEAAAFRFRILPPIRRRRTFLGRVDRQMRSGMRLAVIPAPVTGTTPPLSSRGTIGAAGTTTKRRLF
jgi:ligand-binding sensor domain-containing protein